MAKALRTIPVSLQVARDIGELAPEALLVNFTNPSGLITEVLSRYAPHIQSVGLCNSPITMKMEILRELEAFSRGILPEDAESQSQLNALGLNHLCWYRGFTLQEEELWPQIMQAYLAQLHSNADPEWDPDMVEALGMIPNYYLQYFYNTPRKLADQAKWPPSRAEQVLEIEASLLRQVALRSLGAAFLGGDDESLPLSIGIHSGVALLRPSERGGSVSASGSTISLANRLIQNAGGLVLITHDTYRQVRGIFDVSPDLPLRVRGRAEPLNTYRVLGTKPHAFRLNTRGVEGVETRMIGREAELKHLQNAFLDAFEDGETRVVTISGEAGDGKTRLLYEFAEWGELRRERYFIFRGRATPATVQGPLDPGRLTRVRPAAFRSWPSRPWRLSVRRSSPRLSYPNMDPRQPPVARWQ